MMLEDTKTVCFSKRWIGFYTIVNKEMIRFLRIWSQTLLPSAITTTL